MTDHERITNIQRLADTLAGEVQAFADEQTLSEHIRDRGEWSALELSARRLRTGIAAMAERARGRSADLFDNQASA